MRERARAGVLSRAIRQGVPWGTVLVLCTFLGAEGCRRQKDLASTSTATVAGRVLGSDARPVGGAAVVLTADPDDGRVPIATTKTNATGAFRIARVPAAGYRIRVRASGHVDAVSHVDVTRHGTRPIEIKLTATVVLKGQIQDSRGTPIPLARVLAFAVGGGPSSGLHETRGDDRGAFTLNDLAPGVHRLLIEAPGLGTASAGPVTAPDEKVVVVLSGEIRAVVGRVTRGGQGAKDARVLLGGESVPEPRSTTTDPEGRFVFAGLGPGAYVVRAEAGGLVAPVWTEVLADRASSQTHTVELALVPGVFARGKVVSDDGKPVRGAAVQIDLVPATGLWPQVLTGADGTWTSAPLGPGTYRVRARHPGTVARRTVTIEVGRGTPPDLAPLAPTTLELVRTGKISGRVVDEQGVARSGATVNDRLAETEELGVIWSRLPLAAEAAALPGGMILPNATTGIGGSRRATTDSTGRFALGDVPPGRVRIEVLSPSSIPLRTAPVTLTPGATLDVGTLRLQSANQIGGRVLDVDGQPMGAVRVTATPVSSPTSGGTGLYALTADDGSFTLPLGAGEHRLTASAKGRADTTATVHVKATGIPPEGVTLKFLKGGDLTIEGVVRDTARRPLARARISARAIGDPSTKGGDRQPAPSTIEESPRATAVTDAGGAFKLNGLSAGSLSLDVSHDVYPPYRQVIDSLTATSPARPVSVEVPIPGGIDGEVHERITGAPVPAFQIDARGPSGTSARFPDLGQRRRAGGPLRFQLRRLTPGRWTLHVRAVGYRPLEQVVDVVSAPSLGDASVRDLRLELERS